jgi:DMSO reductase anchor subunit
MKNLKTSWLSREAAALGAFAGLMSANIALYFFDISTAIRLVFELLTLLVGIYGIHAQAMIYRIPARPSWDRFSTNQKFFTTAYTGLFLLALALIISGSIDSATVLLSSAMIAAVIHGFFTLGAYNELKTSTAPQLEKTLRLYRERFNTIHAVRWITLGLGGLALPLLSTLFIASGLTTAAIITLTLGFILVVTSELFDRFLFYTTTVPLQMAGGFFVGVQRK